MDDSRSEMDPRDETAGTDKSSESASVEPDRSPQGDEPGGGANLP
jgi:hypothetical protein